MALVGAGFGITLATQSQAEVTFPGVVYKPIAEDDAWVQVELAWRANERGRCGRSVRRVHARRGTFTQIALTVSAEASRKHGPSP